MTKRYGRNQKRAARAREATLLAEIKDQKRVAAQLREDIGHLRQQALKYENPLGRYALEHGWYKSIMETMAKQAGELLGDEMQKYVDLVVTRYDDQICLSEVVDVDLHRRHFDLRIPPIAVRVTPTYKL